MLDIRYPRKTVVTCIIVGCYDTDHLEQSFPKATFDFRIFERGAIKCDSFLWYNMISE